VTGIQILQVAGSALGLLTGFSALILFVSNRRAVAIEEGKRLQAAETMRLQLDAAHQKIRDVRDDMEAQAARITMQNEQLIKMGMDIEFIKSGITDLKAMFVKHEDRDRK